MKTKLTCLALLLIAFALTNCKKSGDIKSELAENGDRPALKTSATGVAPNTVETIAGTNYQTGSKLVDGPAKTARFYYPFGLVVKKDGSFFIADIYNNAIRKVSPQGIVSTVQLQANLNGERIAQPTYLGFDDSNNLHVICRNVDAASGYSQSWIFAPGGSVLASWWYWYGEFSCLAKDPYENALWFSDGTDIGKHKPGEGGRIGTGYLEYDSDKLPETNERGRTFSAMFVGYNKVKYVAVYNRPNSLIYKLTPSGVFEQIFTNFTFTDISSIIAGKDSRTMYVA
ncbi:MAG: hypothetical protein EOP46_15465, partial [Sphingobacteriaceae bacterium]